MPRQPTLSFDRGTLILHPPPRGKVWVDFVEWDDRIEKFRVPAIRYRELVEKLRHANTPFEDKACQFETLELDAQISIQPFPHQAEALAAWKKSERCGVVVLPTGSGKSYLAQLAIASTPRSTLVVVPTLDLMHQWYAQLEASFPGVQVGLLGGGSRDRTPILVATYDSAAINAETLGSQYALIIFDECHHLPSDFNRVIAEYSIAPYRLGLTATPERSDGRHEDLGTLVGPEVYRRTAEELSGETLADYEVRQIKVKLTEAERERYSQLIEQRNAFLKSAKISFGSINGWQRFIQVSARSEEGRKAMRAHHEAKAIALGNEGKIQILTDLLADHHPEKTLIFTNDNATVYRISLDFLIPAITHKTPVKERHEILQKFKAGDYRTLVVANVLDEGVDVPDASIAIFLAGTGSTRQFIQRLGRILRRGAKPGKRAILYEVIAEDTVEERVSQRRRKTQNHKPEKRGQLELLPGGGLTPKDSPEEAQPTQPVIDKPKPVSPYELYPLAAPKAAEGGDRYSSQRDEAEEAEEDNDTDW